MTNSKYELGGNHEADHAQQRGEPITGGVWRHVWAWRKFIIVLATPFLLAPLPAIVGTSESRCAYVVLLMAIYWFSEAIPVGVTALLPVVLFPTMGVLDVGTTSKSYMKDTIMLFIGGLIVAITIEYWNLHRRIALRILMLVGSEPRWLMLGLMIATWFLSMWISNTATTAMMVPITEAVLQQLQGTRSKSQAMRKQNQDFSTSKGINGPTEHPDVELAEISSKVPVIHHTDNGGVDNIKYDNGNSHGAEELAEDCEDNEKREAEFSRLGKGMSLCICYAAGCGGIASLTGTGPNLILKENSDELYAESSLDNPVNFGSWMAFGLPMSVVILVISWLWLQVAFLGRNGLFCSSKSKSQDTEAGKRVKQLIRDEYAKLGPIVFGQGLVLLMFVLLVALWVTRDMGGTVGWGKLFEYPIKDSVPAIFVAILLFMLPSTLPCIGSYSNYAHPEKEELTGISTKFEIRPLINWHTVNRKMPWQLIFLLGGGFALSSGFDNSGLSDWIGEQLDFVRDWSQWTTLLMVCYIAAGCTEITSNTAMASVLLPIMRRLADTVGAHPLSYMFPVCLSTSFAFMLPVATPPNAIVFTYGRVSISEMAKTGIVLNLLAVPCVVFMTQTLGRAVFGFDESPADFPLNATQSLLIVSE